jgi:hypothetical protein
MLNSFSVLRQWMNAYDLSGQDCLLNSSGKQAPLLLEHIPRPTAFILLESPGSLGSIYVSVFAMGKVVTV